MTTPNNQPTPPDGTRLLTPEEYKNRLPEGSVYSPDGENWYKSGNIGKRPFIQHIYAIPITPTVPATGDTTNEKGGDQRREGTCATCKHWKPCPTVVKGCDREMICEQSRRGGYGFHGQDGRAVITPEDFGCILYTKKQ